MPYPYPKSGVEPGASPARSAEPLELDGDLQAQNPTNAPLLTVQAALHVSLAGKSARADPEKPADDETQQEHLAEPDS